MLSRNGKGVFSDALVPILIWDELFIVVWGVSNLFFPFKKEIRYLPSPMNCVTYGWLFGCYIRILVGWVVFWMFLGGISPNDYWGNILLIISYL